jgi:hypothetical protein
VQVATIGFLQILSWVEIHSQSDATAAIVALPTQPPPPHLSSFWDPRNLSNHMDRQANLCNTVLVKGIEMTGRSQTLPWWIMKGEVKTTGNKIH